MFHHSKNKFRLYIEELQGGILGVILFLWGKINPQGLVIWFQLLQLEGSWKNCHGRVKTVVNVHVIDKFDIWFWCCWWRNCCIFDKVNSSGSWQCLIVFFWYVWLCMSALWENKLWYIIVCLFEWFVCIPAVVYWQGLEKWGYNGIPPFLKLKYNVSFNVQGVQMFGKFWCMWRFLRWF